MIYDALLTARTAVVPKYFGHVPLRSYLNIFYTFIMIVPKYLGHVHCDRTYISWTVLLRSYLHILDMFIMIVPILDTFTMIIPNYLGYVYYDHP